MVGITRLNLICLRLRHKTNSTVACHDPRNTAQHICQDYYRLLLMIIEQPRQVWHRWIVIGRGSGLGLPIFLAVFARPLRVGSGDSKDVLMSWFGSCWESEPERYLVPPEISIRCRIRSKSRSRSKRNIRNRSKSSKQEQDQNQKQEHEQKQEQELEKEQNQEQNQEQEQKQEQVLDQANHPQR